jgi:hypothetical protein
VLLVSEVVSLSGAADALIGHPMVVGALYGVGAIAGVLVGGTLSQHLGGLAGRLSPISSEFQPVLAVAVLTAFASAFGWSLLWSLPLTGLAVMACYVAAGLVVYRPKRWPLVDGVMAGLFCGLVLSLGAITFGLIEPGLI